MESPVFPGGYHEFRIAGAPTPGFYKQFSGLGTLSEPLSYRNISCEGNAQPPRSGQSLPSEEERDFPFLPELRPQLFPQGFSGAFCTAGLAAEFSQFGKIMMYLLKAVRRGEPSIHALIQGISIGVLLDMFREAGTIEDEIGQAYPLHLEDSRSDPVGQRRNFVRHQSRNSGKTSFQRGRSRSRHDAVARPHEAIAVGPIFYNEGDIAVPQGAQILFGEVGSPDAVEREIGIFFQQPLCSSGKSGKQGFHFLAAASGHEPDAMMHRLDVLYALVIHKIHQRIAHIGHVHVVAAIEGDFEGKDGEHTLYMFPQEIHPACTPCPDLGRDEVVHRDAEATGDLGDAEIEVRRVDEQDGVGAYTFHLAPNAAEHAKDTRQRGEYFRNAHDGKFFYAEQVLLPGFGKAVAPHADHAKFAFRGHRAQGRKQRPPLQVTRYLAGVYPQCFHACSFMCGHEEWRSAPAWDTSG